MQNYSVLLTILLLTSGCSTPGILEEAQLAQIKALREACMNNVTNIPAPMIRVSAIHQCSAWARSKVL